MAQSKFWRWVLFNLRYFTKPRWNSGVSPPELNNYIAKTQPGRALDLGAGTGTNMVTLAASGWQIDGIEFALPALWSARNKMRKKNVKANIYFRDVVNMDFLNGPYDLILDIGCFHGLTFHEKRRYLENIHRLLDINGTFLLYAFLDQGDQSPGISENEIQIISSKFMNIQRQDGMDQGNKPSVWLECHHLIND